MLLISYSPDFQGNQICACLQDFDITFLVYLLSRIFKLSRVCFCQDEKRNLQQDPAFLDESGLQKSSLVITPVWQYKSYLVMGDCMLY